MSRYDFTSRRLFVDAPLAPGARIEPPPAALNYLLNVLRLREGAALLAFNGRDGEFRVRLTEVGKRSARLLVEDRTRPQTPLADLDYCFAPLKQARLDYVVEKATEMGAGRLVPVLTARTQVRKVNVERLQANVVEAAEQCGILAVPLVAPAVELRDFLAQLATERLLVFCDEDSEIVNPSKALQQYAAPAGVSVLIGPEGGFDDAERAAIARHPCVARISLGPRILRADTAGVAALALVQAIVGDWGG